MNDAQKIEEGATIDARADLEAIDRWLEDIKQKIHDFQIEKPHLVYVGSSLFCLGVFLGSKVNPKLQWLVHFLSGAGFSYSAIQVILQLRKEKQIEKDPDKGEKDPEKSEKKLKNIKVLNE